MYYWYRKLSSTQSSLQTIIISRQGMYKLHFLERAGEIMKFFHYVSDGIKFPPNEKSIFGPKKSGETLNLADILTNTTLNDNDPLSSIWSIENPNEKPETETEDSLTNAERSGETNDNFEDLGIEFSESVTEKSGSNSGPKEAQWAEVVDISQPMFDFHQRVPNMAYTWPFELDTFQNQKKNF